MIHLGLATSRLFWHGTASGRSGQKLKGILQKGLIDPKRACMKRETCAGVHFTSDPRTALYYAGSAMTAFSGNPLLILARIDVSQAMLDTDLSGDLEELLDEAESDIADSAYEQIRWNEAVVNSHQDVENLLARNASEFLKDSLRRWKIKEYPRVLFEVAVTYLTDLAYLTLLRWFYRSDFLDRFLPLIPTSWKSKLRASPLPTLKKLSQDKRRTANESLQIFLLSPKFTSGMNPEDSVTVSTLDPVGFQGRNRIVSILELITHDEDELEKLCSDARGQKVGLPVAKLHYGQWTQDVLGFVKKWTPDLEAASSDYTYVSGWAPRMAGFAFGTIDNSNVAWLFSTRSKVCKLARQLAY